MGPAWVPVARQEVLVDQLELQDNEEITAILHATGILTSQTIGRSLVGPGLLELELLWKVHGWMCLLLGEAYLDEQVMFGCLGCS